MTKKPENYLISLPLAEYEGRMVYMHCYLMTTNSRDDMEQACDKMLKAAKLTLELEPLPLFVSTGPLNAKTTKMIRSLLSEMPEVKKTLETDSQFHLTVFIPTAEANERLMGIH